MIRGIGHHHHVQVRCAGRRFHRDDARPQRRVVEFGVDVRADDERDAFAQKRQCGRDAAGDFERLAFARVMQLRAEARAVAQGRLDLRAEMGDVDDDVGEACGDQALDLPDDQWLASSLEQRLGARIG
jgi:hypothetical protein